eukprot:TRINITY_DN11816_c0_g1_i1.p2 TRINITY_DN11816_c0_g1~~TRINITY_DN11816_c0_g1_i1.p2  ORF type:complete len:282 (+),score=154.70 TRINITY_DN11816_c0_g1_i1:34-846(+)
MGGPADGPAPEGDAGDGALVAGDSFQMPSTLVQYDQPVRVEEAAAKYGMVGTAHYWLQRLCEEPQIVSQQEVSRRIFPPRDLGGGWVQYVSTKPATRLDARDLTEAFEHRLRVSNARETGICPVRSAIYSMCMDELVRQVTVDCAERGLLCMRIRDELRMTVDAHRTLYEASVCYGRKKAVESERGKQEKIDTFQRLSQQKQDLLKEVKRLQAKLRAMQRCCREQQEADHKKHTAEISFLQQTHKRLRTQEQTIQQLQEEERRRLLLSAM